MAAALNIGRLCRPALQIRHLQRHFAFTPRAFGELGAGTGPSGPSDRLYTKRHEWIQMDADKKVGTVGISEFAQEALGDVVYVELPDVGTELERGETAGAIESVKAASDIYAPVSGKVVERNSKIEDTPIVINKSPYEKGWLFKLEIKDAEQLKELMNKAEYEVFRAQDEVEE
ncbi:Glycine cleavage system H protein [Aphelenchoides fujianensis]|nr:Glycine cleavage system H protein [Aphelenchoides fujianensis]